MTYDSIEEKTRIRKAARNLLLIVAFFAAMLYFNPRVYCKPECFGVAITKHCYIALYLSWCDGYVPDEITTWHPIHFNNQRYVKGYRIIPSVKWVCITDNYSHFLN
jgi:hypothetical protein